MPGGAAINQTGKYVVRAEDLPRASKLPCPQRPIMRAEFEKIYLKNKPFHMVRRCAEGFTKRAENKLASLVHEGCPHHGGGMGLAAMQTKVDRGGRRLS